MDILAHLQAYVNDFNARYGVSFHIDSVRVEFSKEHKLERLKRIGQWERVEKNSPLLPKLKQRLTHKEITSAYRLKHQNIYYYNTNKDRPKYRKAVLVIFGMHQYHKDPPPNAIVAEILAILKNVSSVDVCIDIRQKPNFNALKRYYPLTPYKKSPSQTHYINDTGVPMLEKVVFYDKAFKNQLQGTLWRIEGTIEIPNFKTLALPLSELAEIVKIATYPT